MENCIKATEREYEALWSRVVYQNEDFAYLEDDLIPDMYDHNFFRLVHPCSLKELRKHLNRPFLNIKAPFPLKAKKATPSHNGFYILRTFTPGWINPDCTITPYAKSDEEEAIAFNIRADGAFLGKDFPTRNAKRKALVYLDEESGLTCYCLKKGKKIIGELELFKAEGCAKIENFVIDNEYRKEHYGTTLLSHVIKEAQDCPIIYLVTSEYESVKELYTRYGFEKIGDEYGLFLVR